MFCFCIVLLRVADRNDCLTQASLAQSENMKCFAHRQGLIEDLEKVQMRAAKLVLYVKCLTDKERFLQLKLPTLKYRRTRGNMIKVLKILTGKFTPKFIHAKCSTV